MPGPGRTVFYRSTGLKFQTCGARAINFSGGAASGTTGLARHFEITTIRLSGDVNTSLKELGVVK